MGLLCSIYLHELVEVDVDIIIGKSTSPSDPTDIENSILCVFQKNRVLVLGTHPVGADFEIRPCHLIVLRGQDLSKVLRCAETSVIDS